ncbi:MAG: murein biosynthesis integral membrane protein MurJ [Chloroflexi bacterium]|nr:murein biosynthesis integral membrane protein MurJ [Chloroflexota bacterium]
MTREVRALSTGQIVRAALVVLLGFLASGVLGLVRTAAYTAYFGASVELDVFFAAQRIPEMLFTLVAGGALGSAFIPVFARYLNRDDPQAWRLASAVMSWSAAAAALIGILLAVTSPLVMPLLLRDVPDAYQALSADLTRWMLITTVIFSVSGLTMGILNAHQQFFLPALAISMNNIGLIIGAVVISPLIPVDAGPFAYPAVGERSIYGLAFGAILGAALHLLIQLPGLVRVRAVIRPLFSTRVEGSGLVLRLMLPRMLGLAVTQLNFLVNLYFAGQMVEGSNSALNVAWFIMFFVLGIIAQSVGTAVFPSLARLAAEGDLAAFGSRLTSAMSGILFLAIPASVGLIVLGRPVVALMVERGEWLSDATAGTAWALAFFAVGIAGHGLLEVLSRAFYALSDTRTPVLIGIASLISNIVLSVVFIRFIGEPASLARGPIAGLALANSLTTLLEAAVLWWILSRRIHTVDDRLLLSGSGRSLAVSALMGTIVALLSSALVGRADLIIVLVCGAVGATVYFIFGAAVGIAEARAVPMLIMRRLRR